DRLNALDLLRGKRTVRHLRFCDLGLCQDAAQQVVKVMCDTRCHDAEAFQFLPRKSLILRAFEIGNIDAGGDVAGEIAAWRESGNATREDPSVFSIRSSQPVSLAAEPPLIKRSKVTRQVAVQPMRMQVRSPAISKRLFHRASREIQPDPIEECGQPI